MTVIGGGRRVSFFLAGVLHTHTNVETDPLRCFAQLVQLVAGSPPTRKTWVRFPAKHTSLSKKHQLAKTECELFANGCLREIVSHARDNRLLSGKAEKR